jgi:hypothetical protein
LNSLLSLYKKKDNINTNINERTKETGLNGLNSSRSNCLMDCMLYDERKIAMTLGNVAIRRKTNSPTHRIRMMEGQISEELLLNKGY